jgi:hypothetical protein
MKEFMLLIRNEADHQQSWSPEKHQKFLKACEVYMGNLIKEGKLIKAQPMVREGKMVSGEKDAWKEGHYTDQKEVIVGYYHVLAKETWRKPWPSPNRIRNSNSGQQRDLKCVPSR